MPDPVSSSRDCPEIMQKLTACEQINARFHFVVLEADDQQLRVTQELAQAALYAAIDALVAREVAAARAEALEDAAYLEDALREIAEGRGRFSRDPLTHAQNTIENLVNIAIRSLQSQGQTQEKP